MLLERYGQSVFALQVVQCKTFPGSLHFVCVRALQSMEETAVSKASDVQPLERRIPRWDQIQCPPGYHNVGTQKHWRDWIRGFDTSIA